MEKPVVALVGRPNVGKSTLFNRLAGERLAVVDDVPGTTRDRLLAEAEWNGLEFTIVDTGGIDPTQNIASRQPLSIGSADFIEQIRSQAQMAIDEADVIIFMTDADSGVTSADQEVAEILRRRQVERNGRWEPPVLLVVNKADSAARRGQALQFYELGMGEPYPISSVHGTGTGDMLDALVELFPPQPAGEDVEDESVKIAIVGKPNAGKSSLLNRLLGQERAIVSPIPGTTRDAVDTKMTFNDLPLTLIDTAGIRKRGKIEPGVEKYSVLRSLKAIERADVVLLMIDATSGISAQDTHIAGFILDAWKSAVVLVNKWDAIEKDAFTMEAYTQQIRRELNFMDYVPTLFISAKTGQRLDQVLPLALQVQEERLVRLTTSQLNQIVHKAQDEHSTSSKTGKPFRIYYGTQVRSDPPTFLLYVNDPEIAHFSYMRFLENRIREEYPFLGTPIRIVLRPRR
jgi:GTP-binding protein